MSLEKPDWLRLNVGRDDAQVQELRGLLSRLDLSTVCQAARCPNLPDCWGRGTATFMILRDICTRACRFCAVRHGRPGPVNEWEPELLAQAVGELGLRYVVLTSVDRDDLPDGGAGHFARCIRAIRRASPSVKIEVLIPDFSGDRAALQTVVEAGPDVVGHNLETVRRLTPLVRDPRAGYDLSLSVLRAIKEISPEMVTKSSLLLGFGEEEGEIGQALADLRAAGVDILVVGQYLRPSSRELPVVRYWRPEEFEAWAGLARELGFPVVLAGPLVRTSFRAAESYAQLRGRKCES